jgi:hypothetical protein
MANLYEDPLNDLRTIFQDQSTRLEPKTVSWASECHTYGSNEALEIEIYMTKDIPSVDSKKRQDSIISNFRDKRAKGLNIDSIKTLTDGTALRIKINVVRTQLNVLPHATELYNEVKTETVYKYNPLVPYVQEEIFKPLSDYLGEVPSVEGNQFLSYLTEPISPEEKAVEPLGFDALIEEWYSNRKEQK